MLEPSPGPKPATRSTPRAFLTRLRKTRSASSLFSSLVRVDCLAAFARAFAETVRFSAPRAAEEEEERQSPGAYSVLLRGVRFARGIGVKFVVGGVSGGVFWWSTYLRGRAQRVRRYERENFRTPNTTTSAFFECVARHNSTSTNATTTPDSLLKPPK